ncbi:MAG TPA: alpha/beta fold hydrolase [Actinomycetota bacterium]
MPPEIQFAKSGDVHIAYQVVGDGPVDVVLIQDWLWNLELQWDQPLVARFLERLASFSRLLLFDKRGSGLSDRTVDPDLFTLEVRIDDVRAVMDAARSEQAFVLGAGDDGGSIAAVFGATVPERTRGLLLFGSRAKGIKTDDYPFGYDPSASDVWASETATFWGSDAYGRRWLRTLAPSIAHDDSVVRWYARMLRQTASPGTEVAFEQATVTADLRGILSAIHVPTLVLHRTGDPDIPVEAGRDLAERIPGARFVELPGADAFPWAGEQDALLDEVEAFVTGSRPSAGVDRVLSTVLFTDIVGSTEKAAAIGDAPWKDLLVEHDAIVRGALERHRGEEVVRTGDGFLATFEGPARAVRCAREVADDVRPLGLEIRAGCHTGEIEHADGTIRGIAVHVAARVMAAAGPSEVWVSSTVKDLVGGSGLAFEERGTHELKGVPGEWQLFAEIPERATRSPVE